MSKGSFAQAFLSKKSLFEIVGTIVLLATLFSSVGFSGWNFSDNTILNPNLYDSNHDGYPDYASGTDWSSGFDCWNGDATPNDDWTFGTYSNVSNIIMIDKRCDQDYHQELLKVFITPHFEMNVSRKQLIEFMFLPTNGTLYMSAVVSDNGSGDYCRDFNEVLINATSGAEQINFYPVFYINQTNWASNITITNLTDGWKNFSGWGEFVPPYMYLGNITHYRLYFYTRDDYSNFSIANFSAKDYYYEPEAPVHTLDVALNYPDDTSMNDTNNIYFGYTPSSSDAIDNCSIYLNTSGAWQIYGTETNVTNGSINNFLLANASNQTLTWGIECANAYMTVFSENRTLTIAKAYPVIPCEGWECATTARAVVGLSPIVIGLGIIAGLLAMFVMRDEEESMIALVMKGGVIALISVVMLSILMSVIG